MDNALGRPALTCRGCGTELPKAARFCSQCGLAVAGSSGTPSRPTMPDAYTPRHLAERILTAKSTLEGERKHLTVLFADLKGSMQLLSERDPEDGRRILDPVLEYMMEAVHRYEGTVTQVMGDGIMALFGAPLAHEDHAVRACYAASQMQATIGRYSDEIRRREGIPIQIRVGLNSGEVVVHSIGNDLHMHYTAVGQTTHLAARMEQAANPGSVLLTQPTFRLVEGYVDARPIGALQIKGMSEPVEAYELRGVGRARSRVQAGASRGLTDFVDREAAFQLLGEALASAGSGRGQVVSMVGEPGIGKSRLIHEFVHARSAEPWLVLESGAAPPGKAPPGLAVANLLKSYAGIEVDADGAGVREQLSTKVLNLDPALRPFLTPLMALLDASVDDAEWSKLDPPQRLRLSLDAFKRLLIRESEVQPVLLVFDDLQTQDSVTHSFLDGLVEGLAEARILLLAGYRPDFQCGWQGNGHHRHLVLDPLPDAFAETMLDALIGRHAELRPLKRLLIARTEGNPFFIEEIVRTLVETGGLSGQRGIYRLSKDPETIQVPATVEAVLSARIDRLPPEEKRLLQSAAVVGHDVPLVLLRAIADVDEDTLQRGLERLQAAEFLHRVHRFAEPEHAFRHALTHQVAYASLLRNRRRELHRRIVDVLEQAHAHPDAKALELLAHHAFCGELWEKAVDYCRRAGLAAASRPAHREAVTRFEQALEALERLPPFAGQTEVAIDIRFDLRNSLHPLGQLERILKHIRTAESLASSLGDQRRLGQASSFLCQYHRLMGDLGLAIEAGERAVAISDRLGDLPLWIVARSHFGPALAARGDHRRAAEILTAIVERLGGDLVGDAMGTTGILSVFARIYLVSSLAELGELDAAMRHAEEAVKTAENRNHVYSQIFAAYGLGSVLVLKGDLPAGIAALEGGVDLCRSWNLPLGLPLLATALGQAYCLDARPDQATTLLEEAERQAGAMTRMGGHAMLLVRLGEAYLQMQRHADARRCAESALALSRNNTELGLEAYALRLLAELEMRKGEGEALYRRALQQAERLQMRPLVALCHLGLGKLYRTALQRDSAEPHLQAAAALFRTLGMAHWQDQTETLLA